MALFGQSSCSRTLSLSDEYRFSIGRSGTLPEFQSFRLHLLFVFIVAGLRIIVQLFVVSGRTR